MAINAFFVVALLFLPSVEPLSANLTQYVYGLCNTANFAGNSSFARNLNTVLGLLEQRSSLSLFHNATSISNPTSNSSDNAYGFFQCRGDLSLSDCAACVYPIIISPPCNSAVGSRIQLQGCFIRYENYNFLATLVDNFLVKTQCSNSSGTSASFRANLASLLNVTAEAAPADGGFYSSSRGSGDNTAYVLAQCLGYLSPSQCASCLQIDNYNTLCPTGFAGGAYYATCYYIYSNASLNSSLSSTAPPPTISPAPAQSTIPAPAPALPISPIGGKVNSSPENRKTQSKLPVIVGAAVGAILLAVLCALLILWVGRRRKLFWHSSTEAGGISSLQNFPVYNATKFSLAELRKATNNFQAGNKLGEGGFGPVYKGRLPNGREVAVKMLAMRSHQGTTQFLNEVNLITTVQHRNLVELLGYCVSESKRALVYEYLPNRSLDVHLFGEGEGEERLSLNWRTRCDIVIGIARGLQYLHEDSHVKIVHRDIKPSNILLDNNLSPKIADFGLAKLFQDHVSHFTTRVAGTMGYLSPEYAMGGQLTEKVDVYSFGLVALEIVSGRRIMDQRLQTEKQQLLEWTWKLYENRQQLQVLDPRLVGQAVAPGEVIRMVHVALLCTQTNARARPAMSKVLAMLCSQSDILELPTKPLLVDMNRAELPVVSSSEWSSNPSQLPAANRNSNTN